MVAWNSHSGWSITAMESRNERKLDRVHAHMHGVQQVL